MDPSINILVTSASKKVPLINAVRDAMHTLSLSGKVIGGDAKGDCIARYFVDAFWEMPIEGLIGIDELIAYCTHHHIGAIIPTRDGELAFFADHHETLRRRGIDCMISPPKAVQCCRNKQLFFETLSRQNIPAIPTSKSPDELRCASYVVKECRGSGSQAIGLELSLQEAKELAKRMKEPIFQPFVKGSEYSIDLYIAENGEPKGTVARKRNLVVGGESQITTSEHLPKAEALCANAARLLGIRGHAVFQVIRDPSDHIHIVECNPRFGGASTLSIAMGLNTFGWFFQECLHLPLSPFERSPVEMKQIRYPKDKILSMAPLA